VKAVRCPDRVAPLVPKGGAAPHISRSAVAALQPALHRVHVLGPAALAAQLNDRQRVQYHHAFAVSAIDPEPVAVSAKVGNRIEAFGRHTALERNKNNPAMGVEEGLTLLP
jgi:hypothetical protein